MRYSIIRKVLNIRLVASSLMLTSVYLLSSSNTCLAAIQGPCSDCHTMHDSQNNTAMAFDNSGPYDQLLKGDCFGCHAIAGAADALYNTGITDTIPQVLHVGANDLAGGNFAYITGDKGAGGDAMGHNIVGLGGMGADGILDVPPGQIRLNTHYDSPGVVESDVMSCTSQYSTGTKGCHGVRSYSFGGDPIEGVQGAHHDNSEGALNPSGDWKPGHGYRFLVNVTGYEDSQWEYTVNSTTHNEYFALSSPININNCNICHVSPGGVQAINGTMSQFCATCHGNFHTLYNTFGSGPDNEGIGTNAVSPFLRHPTDLTIPNATEYQFYTTYNPQAPPARTSAPGVVSDVVQPGTDAVMCLSCHVAHASPYPDMLRWDYTQIIAGGGGADDTGCFVCHTLKDGT